MRIERFLRRLFWLALVVFLSALTTILTITTLGLNDPVVANCPAPSIGCV